MVPKRPAARRRARPRSETSHSTRTAAERWKAAMRALDELTIRGTPEQLTLFLQKLEGSVGEGWKRDKVIEARLRQIRRSNLNAYCFSCSTAPARPAAA